MRRMSKKFCPKCGKEVEKFYDNLCKDCFLSQEFFVQEIPSKISIKKCKECGNFFFGNESFSSEEEAIRKYLERVLKKDEVKDLSIWFNKKLHVILYLRIYDLVKTEEKPVNFSVKLSTCKYCSLKKFGYYQVILQIRGNDEEVKKIAKYIEDRVRSLERRDRLSFISKSSEVKNGVDLYVGSRPIANLLAREISRKYGIKLKISRKFCGFKNGKKVFKETILIDLRV